MKEPLLRRLLARLPHKDITKDGTLYLRRHYLTPRTWPYKVFLHLINRPDGDRDPHCHPWPFWTLVLRGGYAEAFFDRGTFKGVDDLGPGAFRFRPATHTHLIHHLDGPTWTLVLAGPATRTWGFWNALNEFIPWFNYIQREDGAKPEPLPEDVVR